MRGSLVLLAMLALAPAALVAQTAQSAQREVRVTGAAARLKPLANTPLAANGELRGELIAVGHDSVWIRIGNEHDLTGVAARDLARARVERHRYGAGFAARWALIGWAATSAGLTFACAQESEGCLAVPLVMVVPWGVALAIAAPTMESSRWLDVSPRSLPEARPFARFPQDLARPPRAAADADSGSPQDDSPTPDGSLPEQP